MNTFAYLSLFRARPINHDTRNAVGKVPERHEFEELPKNPRSSSKLLAPAPKPAPPAPAKAVAKCSSPPQKMTSVSGPHLEYQNLYQVLRRQISPDSSAQETSYKIPFCTAQLKTANEIKDALRAFGLSGKALHRGVNQVLRGEATVTSLQTYALMNMLIDADFTVAEIKEEATHKLLTFQRLSNTGQIEAEIQIPFRPPPQSASETRQPEL